MIFLLVDHHWRSSDRNSITTTTILYDSSSQSIARAISTGANGGTHVSGSVLVAIVVVAAVVAILSLLRRTEAAKTVTFRRPRILEEVDESLPSRPPAKRWVEDFNRYVREHSEPDGRPNARLPGPDD